MKKIAVALFMLSLCCVGCVKKHDSREARDKPKSDAVTRQIQEEVVKEGHVVNDRVDAERIQADVARTAEKVKANVQEIKDDVQRAEAEIVHNVAKEAKRDVEEIKSDAKRTAKKLIDDFLQ